MEISDERGLVCKSGVVPIAKLKMMPQFKLGADAETGEVSPLRGDYFADHDPIRVWRRSDGTMMVISGRHRLAHAKRAGVDRISAYVYDESNVYNEAWARRLDIELNIRDNQATALEVAMYVRGEFAEDKQPLTDAQVTAAGIAREGKIGSIGYRIGRHACDSVMDALRDKAIEDSDALAIADFCPGNESVQGKGLKVILDGGSKTEARARMEAELAKQKMAREVGVEGGTDLFGNALEDEAFWDFVAKYVVGRRNELAKDALFLRTNVGKRNSSAMTKKYGVDLKDPESLKKALKEIDMLRERWKSPYGEADLMEEIKQAWQAKQEGEGKTAAQVFERYAQRLRERENGVTDYSAREEEKRYRVENDRVGLSARLNEKVQPVEINFTGDLAKEKAEYEQRLGRKLSDVAYYREAIAETLLELAKKYPDGLEIEDSGVKLIFPTSRGKAVKAQGRARNAKKRMAVTGLEEVVRKAVHLGSEEPQHKKGESKRKKGIVATVSSFEKFGYPVSLNGVEMLFWFNGAPEAKGAKRVIFYEFGVTDVEKKEAGATRDRASSTLTSQTPASETTLGDVLSRVKNKNVVDVKKDIPEGGKLTVAQAQERGMFKDGVMEVSNGIIVAPDTDYSVDFSHVSRALYRRPDREHVGTGEGNAAFGWGYIYGAESPGVNRSYHGHFTQKVRGGFSLNGKVVSKRAVLKQLNKETGKEYLLKFLNGAFRGNADEYRQLIEENRGWIEEDKKRLAEAERGYIDGKKRSEAEIKEEKAHLENAIKNRTSKLEAYEWLAKNEVHKVEDSVRYPVNYRMRADVDDGNLLHWDEKLDRFLEEHADVAAAFGELLNVDFDTYFDVSARNVPTREGRELYEQLAKKLGSARAASEWLDAHGIRGVKYEDGSTRHKEGKKTYNYVIFNPDYIEVIAINNRHEWSEYSEDNPDWQRPEEVFGDGAVTDYSVRRAEEDALRAHWQENYDGRPPEGWYVHGRHGRKDLNTGNVVLATQDNTVALQYSGILYAGAESDGSVWYIRPREGEKVIDMRTEEGREAVREFVRDCVEENDELYEMAQRWASDNDVDMYTEDGEVREDVIEGVVDTFDPKDIVDSAEAYDLPELMGPFWEYVKAPMVVTSRGGAVVLDREGVDAVMVDDGRGASSVTDYSVAGMRARTAGANMDRVYRDPADGKEKFVIPTANARLSTGFTLGQLKAPVGGHKDASLGAILEYPELYEAYPELKGMRVRLYNPRLQEGVGGFFARPRGEKAGYLALNTGVEVTPERVMETLLHESQHAIQAIEGHAMGAGSMNAEEALEYLDRAIAARKGIMKAAGDDAWSRENLAYLEAMRGMVQGKEGRKMQEVAISQVYWYSHGEQEARFTGAGKDGDPMAEGSGLTENSPTTFTIAVPGEATELGGVTFGGMGRFSYLLESRLGTAGEFNYDRAVYQMKEAVVRRMKELRMLGDSKDERARGVQLAAEALATMESLESLLPATYRFGLEAYKVYFSSYAKLAGSGSAAAAGRMVPMAGWGERMKGAYEKIAWMAVEGHFYKGDREFWGEHWKKVERILPPLQEKWEELMRDVGPLTGKARADAIAVAWMELKHELPEEMRTLMQAVGEVRADKLMAKFMERVALQLDAFRKDKTLGRIRRVVGALTPGAKENGKPVKGRMDAERYRKVVDMVRLMELTRGEKELFERERYTGEGTEKAWADLEPNDTVTVKTYDADGNVLEIACSKEEFETYACFETMTASQAEAASRALGEYIATGRQAWDNAQEAARQRIAELCAPAMERYGETENEKKARREKQQRKVMPLVNKTLNFLGFGLNDAQFFDACSKVPEIEKWTKDAVYRIASAHTYIEAKERDRQDFMTQAAREASGEKDDKKVREWLDDTRRNRDTGIKLVPQEPDFAAQETETVRRQFMGLLRRKTHKKNFKPNTFAEALRYLTEEDGLMPEEVAREALDKYGTLGDAKASSLKGKEALVVLLTDNEYARFSDLVKTAQNRAEAAREKWQKEREEEEAKRKEEGKPKEVEDPFSKSFAQRVIAAFSGQKQPKKKDIFTLCKYPVLLQQLKPWGGNVHINWENMYKLSKKHYLTPEQIARLPKDLNQPVAVLEDFDGSLLVVADMTAPTRESMKKYEGTGNKGDIVRRNVRAVLKLKKSNKTGVDVVDMSSAYAPDKSDKLAGLLKQRKLLYLDKTRAGEWANKEESTISPLLRTLLASPDSGVMVKETSPDVKQNNEETLVLSPAHAAYRVLLCEQADYTESLSMQGYTPEVVQRLREFAGDKVMRMAYALREKMGERTEEIRDMYERVYGMPFPEVENYDDVFGERGWRRMVRKRMMVMALAASQESRVRVMRQIGL